MSNERTDWIKNLIDEAKARKDAADSYDRLTYKIIDEAQNLLNQILEAVRRDIKRLNDELYHATIIAISGVSSTGFTIHKEYTPANSMSVELNPEDHALEYTHTVYSDSSMRGFKKQTEKIEIIAGRDINDLRFMRGSNLFSFDDISRTVLTPVVREGEREE
jgi:hypothetical protein